jgi:lipopolysaccharide transport system permease protein
VLAGLLDFCIAFFVLILMMCYFHIYPSISSIYLPFLVLLLILTASGVGMVLAALNAKYRDIQYTIPFLVQLWMFASPIVYPSSLIPERYRIYYALNPMVGIIEGFRSALLRTDAFPTQTVLVSSLVSLTLFLVGLVYFKQVERYFADVL